MKSFAASLILLAVMLGGMAWNYYYVRRLIEGENMNDETWLARQRKMMSEEHEAIIYEYLDKCTKISSKLDSLVGWNNYRDQFWSDLIWNHRTAEEVSASMENILNTAIKDTVE